MSLKEKDKYLNWYSGLSTILLKKTEGTSVKFNPVSMASGEVETPAFREQFDREKFVKTLDYSLTLEAPPLENVNIVINLDYDIHEFDDSLVIIGMTDDKKVLFNSKDFNDQTQNHVCPNAWLRREVRLLRTSRIGDEVCTVPKFPFSKINFRSLS